jgi:hypothetical protein
MFMVARGGEDVQALHTPQARIGALRAEQRHASSDRAAGTGNLSHALKNQP